MMKEPHHNKQAAKWVWTRDTGTTSEMLEEKCTHPWTEMSRVKTSKIWNGLRINLTDPSGRQARSGTVKISFLDATK